MKIIDTNAILGYVAGKTEPQHTVEDLIQKMDTSGVDAAVAYHSRSSIQVMPGNDDMQKIAEASQNRIKACWVLHPYLDGVQMPKADDLMALLKKKRPAAVRLIPKEHRYLLNDFYCDDLFAILDELRIPVLLNFRADVYYPLETLPKVTEEHPNIPFVLTDVCHKNSVLTWNLLRKRKNVYFPVGYMCGTGELDQLVNVFGADHFLFGSSDGNNHSGALGLVYQGRFSQEKKESIFSGNWERLQEDIRWVL